MTTADWYPPPEPVRSPPALPQDNNPRSLPATAILVQLLGRSGIAALVFSIAVVLVTVAIGILWSLTPADDFADLPVQTIEDSTSSDFDSDPQALDGKIDPSSDRARAAAE